MRQTVGRTGAGVQVHLAADAGTATFPDDTHRQEGLPALAERAMFHVKETARGPSGSVRHQAPDRTLEPLAGKEPGGGSHHLTKGG